MRSDRRPVSAGRVGCQISRWGSWLFALAAFGALMLNIVRYADIHRVSLAAAGFMFLGAAAAICLGLSHMLICPVHSKHRVQPWDGSERRGSEGGSAGH